MSLWKEYYSPTTIPEALTLLDRHAGEALIVAGGTDLILDMQQGNHAPVQALVDVTAIPGLREIREEGGWVVIGAAVTHAQIEEHPLIQCNAAVLVESCGVVGGPQVRNVATIGGNVAHALPAADGTIGLLTMDAEVQVWTLAGEDASAEWKPLLAIFAGPGRNNLSANQMLGAFRFKLLAPHSGSTFDRIMRPQGVALPVLGLGGRLTVDSTGTRVVSATIAIGPAGPVPFRAARAEAVLISADTFDDAVIAAAIVAAQEEVRFRSSKHRSSKAYRHEMLSVLLNRVLCRAFERASTATA